MKYLLIAIFAFPVFLAAHSLDTPSDNFLVTADVDQELLIPNPQSLMRDSDSGHSTGNGKLPDDLLIEKDAYMGHRGRGHGTGNG